MRKLFTAAAGVLVVSVGFAAHAAVPPLDPERAAPRKGHGGHDLEQLAGYYHPDVTVYEGGGIDRGWAAYRDKHLGPELKAFENLQFAHHDLNVQLLDGGTAAYATARYTLKAKMRERDVDSERLATYVIVKGSDGAWKIRHSHTSSRPRRPAAQ